MYKATNKNNTAINVLKACIFISVLFQLLFNLISCLHDCAANFALCVNTYVLFAVIIVYVFAKGVNKHFLLFGFLFCFFVFLMGQKFFIVLRGGEYDRFLTFKALTLDGKEYLTFVNLLYFSLISCFVGYFSTKRRSKAKKVRTAVAKKPDLKKMLRLLRVAYIVTFICTLVMQVTIILAKRDLSYTDGYLVNVNVNPVIKIGNYLFLGVAFLYLACKPSKKEMLCVLISFMLVQGGVQLFIGRRALLAQVLLFIMWYCICYFKLDEKKFALKHFILLVAFALAVIVLFYIVEVLRGGQSVNEVSLFGAIEKFFISTGGSDSTIANVIRYQDKFPQSGIVYLFSPIRDALFDNIITRKIFSFITGYSGEAVAQGLEYLTRHNTFSHWLSYIVNPDLYLSGYGMGSSYISELYFAFGIIGIIVFGFVLGFVIKKCGNVFSSANGIYVKAFVMFFVYNLFILPRASVFSAATDLLYFIAALIVIKLLYSLFCVSDGEYSYRGGYERIS